LDDAPNVSVEALGALELVVADGLVLTAGGGATVLHAVGSPDVRAFVGIGWTPMSAVVEAPDEDPDHDGILAANDKCPDAAEDKDGFEDQDGCPDPDNDKDGIADAADKCPNAPEDKDGDEDQDGCPEADKDGDKDGDGLADSKDKCPTEAEDKDGFEDEDGCPDPDNDQDGIPDSADKCPNEPEDKDGVEDGDGCPDVELDRDGDGILDKDDKCPDLPEVKNGVKDDDGCPDTADKDIELTERELKILKKVNFARDADKIANDSFALLDTVAKVLSEHGYLTKVRVEGHTDSEGPDDFNLQLSQRRAEAVVAYLVGKGVDGQRLVAQGFGESRPLAKNDTPGGRAKNRRVEFKILEVLGKPLPEQAPPPPR
jgi:outer membrane protein OmpA-like peptidoglycan-associated protein